MGASTPSKRIKKKAEGSRADMPSTHRAADDAGTYRLTGRFIKITTTVLIVVMLGAIVVGFIIGLLSDNFDGDTGDTLQGVAGGLVIGGIMLPLLIAAILGGEAIKRGGGVVGFFLIVGMFSLVAGTTDLGKELIAPEWLPLAVWGGGGLMVLSVAGFWVIGWIAKVPMWLQAPMIGSPRVYVRGSSDRAVDVVLPNKYDGTENRPTDSE